MNATHGRLVTGAVSEGAKFRGAVMREDDSFIALWNGALARVFYTPGTFDDPKAAMAAASELANRVAVNM